MIDKYLNLITEPSRLRTCPALIRDMAQATQRKRHVFIGAEGERRERMPMTPPPITLRAMRDAGPTQRT